MYATAAEDQLAKEKAEQLIADIPMMPGVESIRVEPYIDWTNDPSLQLTFRLSKDIRVDREFLARYREFTGTIQTRILSSDINRFPYKRLEHAA